MLDPRTRIIPGHGPVASGQDLRQWREMLATIDERVKKSVAAGRSLEQVKAERPTKEWDERFPRRSSRPTTSSRKRIVQRRHASRTVRAD